MSKEASLYSLLSGNAGVSALISTKIFPVKAPQNTEAPFLVYRQITQDTQYLLNGTQDSSTAVFQLTSVASTMAEAISISNAVFSAMNLASQGTGQYAIKKIFHENQTSGYYEEEDKFYVRDDYTTWFNH